MRVHITAFDAPYRVLAWWYWASLITVGSFGLALLGISAACLKWAWQLDLEGKTPWSWVDSLKRVTPSRRQVHLDTPHFLNLQLSVYYARVLARKPLRRGVVTLLYWAGFGLCLFAAGVSVLSSHWREGYLTALFSAFGMHVLLKCQMGLAAVQTLNEDMNDGALELVLGTPMRLETIQQALEKVFRDNFDTMRVVLTWVNLSLWALAVIFQKHLHMTGRNITMFGVVLLGGGVLLWTDSRALFWGGMKNALAHGRMLRGWWATMLPILVVPWLALFFYFLSVVNLGWTQETAIQLFLEWQALSAGLGLWLARRGRSHLAKHFREWTALRGRPPRVPGGQ